MVLLEYMEQQASKVIKGADSMRAVTAMYASARTIIFCPPVRLCIFRYLQPPLLNRPGMGAKLVTYYRKQKADDVGHQKLKQGVLRGQSCSVV